MKRWSAAAPRRSFALVLICGFSMSAAAAPPKISEPPSNTDLGFVVGGRDDLLKQCKRVGLLPLTKPPIAGGDPAAAGKIESTTARFLADAGFEVVPSTTYVAAFDKFNRAIGGIYSPTTGKPRPGALSGVVQNALREYVEQDHLDCVASATLYQLKLNVGGKLVQWDGVAERVNGQPPPGGISDFIFANGQMSGTLPALSIQLQLIDRANKVLFGRRGGVQLLAYHDPSRGSGTATFLAVPNDKLLQDDLRIERALRFATEPLRYSPEVIAAGANDPSIATWLVKLEDLPPVPAGIVPGEASSLKFPRDQVLANIHRVALGPLYPADFKVPPELAARYLEQVRAELKRLGWEVIDAGSLDAVAAGAFQKVGGTYDPLTGVQDPAKVSEMMRLLFSGLAITPSPDALLTVALTRTQAPQKWGIAAWDGTEQDALSLGTVTKGPKFLGGSTNPSAGEGSVAASAVRVVLRDSANTILYDGAGGIELLQQLSLTPTTTAYRVTTFTQKLSDRAPQELFQDQAREAHAIHMALRELVMSPAEIAAENKPDKPKAH